jgi:hypothetical protein
MNLYQHVPHPHILHRRTKRPVRVSDQFARRGPITRFNTTFALSITAAVGSMWCAYIFAAIALFGLPSAIHSGLGGVVQWIAQTFLQLVLLSIIIVGQNVQAAAADARAENTYQDAEAVLHEALQIQEHLLSQDQELERLVAILGTPPEKG